MNMVSILGANLKRAFIVFWNIVKVEPYFISIYFPVAGKELQIWELLYNCENTVFSTEKKRIPLFFIIVSFCNLKNEEGLLNTMYDIMTEEEIFPEMSL